jgi:formate C-acetyltransferase
MTYQDRLDVLRATKLRQTREKQEVLGPMDYDDWGIGLPPPEARQVTRAISGSRIEIVDVVIPGVNIKSNHPCGGWFGPEICGRNFRALLEVHPVYVDPMSSLAGAYMANFTSYRTFQWPEELTYPRLAELEPYKQLSGIGASHHLCQDLAIGLELGWGGLLHKIRFYRDLHAPSHAGFYNGLEHVVLGVQDWIHRTANAALEMARTETHAQLRRNLEEMAAINERMVAEPPETFREACQWIAWYQMAARMYNGNGSIGRLDVLLRPYYEHDMAVGRLTDEEAIFHVACLYIKETGYSQLGGPDAEGRDVTGPVSFVCLEAAHRLGVPVNVGIAVGEGTDPRLLRRGVEILCADRSGSPKFIGVENAVRGFIRNGIPPEVARLRAFAGCAHFALPGREYCLATGATINLAGVFDTAFHNLLSDPVFTPTVEALRQRFIAHLEHAVELAGDCFDFHMEHMHEVFPELLVDLCSHGPLEKGLDCSQPGGVEYALKAVDGMGLATVADSFAAIEQRVVQEGHLTWAELKQYIDSDWAGVEGERKRRMMHNIHRFGYGGSRADDWAQMVAQTFAATVKAKPTPARHGMIPGLYSWKSNIDAGQGLRATPNGRHANAPISHGASPDPGFRWDGAPTALSHAITSVEMGWGNTVTMQLELDLGSIDGEEAVDRIVDLIAGHMKMGGTLININVLNKEQILAAYKNPELYPDLIVRVTGFSAYWSSLSPEMREFVLQRIISESV